MFDLTGKVAVITGSTKGIGRAIAERMAEAGATTVISSRKADKCAEVAEAIAATGGKTLAVPCNIGHKEQLQSLVDRTIDALGRIDILVCNAAVNPTFGPSAEMSDETFDLILQRNIHSNVWLCNMAIPGMAARNDGAVIIVSSIAGYRGDAVVGAYAISKAADFQLARNLAVEWGHKNIRANAIAPGLIRTDFARALWTNPETLARVERMTPLGRIGEPDDVAGAAVFLASPAGRFVTGQVLAVDGGVTVMGAREAT